MTINKSSFLEYINKDVLNKRSSAWKKGVVDYSIELIENVEDLEFTNTKELRKALLNGATNWSEYSWGGCSLIYDGDIAKRLCTLSEYKRKRAGVLQPNSREQWLDTQARALSQASGLIQQFFVFGL